MSTDVARHWFARSFTLDLYVKQVYVKTDSWSTKVVIQIEKEEEKNAQKMTD